MKGEGNGEEGEGGVGEGEDVGERERDGRILGSGLDLDKTDGGSEDQVFKVVWDRIALCFIK